MGDSPALVGRRDFFQAGFVGGGVVIVGLRVIQNTNPHASLERRVDGIDDHLQLVLVNGDVQRPPIIHRPLDESQQAPEQTIFQPLPRGVGPGLDGQVFVGTDQRVKVGKLALERLTGGHRAVEDDTLMLRQAIVGRDGHFQELAQLRCVSAAVRQVNPVMDRHARIDRVIGPAKFLQRRLVTGRGVELGKGVGLAGEGQAVEQEQPGLVTVLLLDGKAQQPLAPGFGEVHGEQDAVGAGVGLDPEIVLGIGDEYAHGSLL